MAIVEVHPNENLESALRTVVSMRVHLLLAAAVFADHRCRCARLSLAHRLVADSVLHLVQALQEDVGRPRLVLVTRDSQAVRPGDRITGAWQAPLWGLGQRIFFLHDGRTSDLMQAIQAHRSFQSEATAVIERFNFLQDSQKQDLLNFLRAL